MDKRCEVSHFLQEIQGCEKTDEVNVYKWFSADCEGDQQLSDQELVSLIKKNFDEESDMIDEAI